MLTPQPWPNECNLKYANEYELTEASDANAGCCSCIFLMHTIAIVMHSSCWFNFTFSIFLPLASLSHTHFQPLILDGCWWLRVYEIRRCRIVCVVIADNDCRPFDANNFQLCWMWRTNAWIWGLIMFNVSIYSLNAYCYWLKQSPPSPPPTPSPPPPPDHRC